jgi:hypothetical protein
MPIPIPGTQEWEDMADFMKKDLESNMGYTKIIEAGRTLIENKRECLECGEVWQIHKDSTGYCEVCGSANIKHFDFNEEFEKYKKENL